MSLTSRVAFARAPACTAPEVSARSEESVRAQDSRSAGASFTVEGEVLEVLDGYGLAHVRAPDGSTYGLNRQTPGIQFADLYEGQRIRVEVTRKFNRVLHAQVLG